MLVSFLIMLREGVEAALIVGIIASYLRKSGREAWMPAVWAGIFLAIALSLFVGAGLQWANAEFPQKLQELFEAIVGLAAVVVLTTMVFWMRKVSRSIGGKLRSSMDAALMTSAGGGMALVGMVFFAVAREGLESVFFLLATFQQGAGMAAPLGALLGLGVAIVLGYAIYAGGVRLDLRRFFKWTGLFIIVVAAGILAGSVRALHEAGVWNHLQQIVFDVSDTLPVDGFVGAIFAGLLGYNDAPTASEVIAYVSFLVIFLTLFLVPLAHLSRPSSQRTSSGAAV